LLTIPIVLRVAVILCNGQAWLLCGSGAAAWKRALSLGYADLEAYLHIYKQPDSLQMGKKVLLQMVIKP